MSDTLERAQDALDQARETNAREAAILISILAAGLALADMQEKGAQNQYLTHHIAVSDDYAYYQAKGVRATSQLTTAAILESLPNAADPEVAKRAAAARAEAARLADDPGAKGQKQLLAQAERDTEQREAQHHLYERYELVVGALQIAIVLASVSVVTRVRTLVFVASAIGLAAIVAGVLVFTSVL